MTGEAFSSSFAWRPDDAPSEPAEPVAMPVRWMPPDNEVPGLVGLGAVVSRTTDVAVLLLDLKVYSTGVVLELALLRRVEPDPSTERYPPMDQGVLVGVEAADGRVATSVGAAASRLRLPEDDAALALSPLGGGGGGRTYEMSYWLTPAPPPGDLVVHVVGEPLGLPEGHVVVSGAVLAEARERGARLWPREPAREWAPEDLPPPQVPHGGWFERATR